VRQHQCDEAGVGGGEVLGQTLVVGGSLALLPTAGADDTAVIVKVEGSRRALNSETIPLGSGEPPAGKFTCAIVERELRVSESSRAPLGLSSPTKFASWLIPGLLAEQRR
jgi:hypothetical protein